MNHVIQAMWETIYRGGLFSVAFIGLSVIQWVWVIQGWRGKKTHSLIPLLGGILGCLGVVFSGVPGAKGFWWVPFVIDPGSILMIGGGIYAEIVYRKSSKPGK